MLFVELGYYRCYSYYTTHMIFKLIHCYQEWCRICLCTGVVLQMLKVPSNIQSMNPIVAQAGATSYLGSVK